jgi:hypothetical protein
MPMHEFRWGVKPAIPGKWHGTLEHDGFDVEIACDWIEVRKEDHHDLDVQQRNAKQIVDGVIRRIGLADKMRFTATLGSVSRFDPQSNRRDINVFVSDSLGLKASAHADVVVTSADGRIVADSRKDRMDELFSFVDTSAANETLRRMSDYMLEYHDDPEKKLAPLFDIIELAAKVFAHEHKAATTLGIGIQRMKDATNIMNDSGIRTGRHRGQEAGSQREPTPAEAQLCESVAEEIVTEYTNLVQRGAAPR